MIYYITIFMCGLVMGMAISELLNGRYLQALGDLMESILL